MKWSYKFLQGIHPTSAKTAQSEFALWAKSGKLKDPKERYTKLSQLARDSLQAGVDHYRTFFKKIDEYLPLNKKAFQLTDPWLNFDVEDMVDTLSLQVEEKLGQGARRLLSTAYKGGGSPGQGQLEKTFEYEHAKGIVRSTLAGLYVMSFLLKLNGRGVESVKRVEIDDNKVCPICKRLRNKEYRVDYLINQTNPVTFPSHPSCRATYIPIINDIGAYSDNFLKNDNISRVNFKIHNIEFENVPIEVKPMMASIARRFPLPRIRFKPGGRTYYKGGQLIISDDDLRTEDVRYIIGREMGKLAYTGTIKANFEKHYPEMIKLGLVTPPLETSNMENQFKHLYIDYMNNGLDDAFEVIYFKTYLDGTEFGRYK